MTERVPEHPDYKALVAEARRRVNAAVPAWGWCAYPTITRGYADAEFIEEEAWTISEPYCAPGMWCGDGECIGRCGREAIRTGAEGCEEDWMSTPVAMFVSEAPQDVRALADAVEALLAENEVAERGVRIAAHRIFELRAERDELQAQINAMSECDHRFTDQPLLTRDFCVRCGAPKVKEEGK